MCPCYLETTLPRENTAHLSPQVWVNRQCKSLLLPHSSNEEHLKIAKKVTFSEAFSLKFYNTGGSYSLIKCL